MFAEKALNIMEQNVCKKDDFELFGLFKEMILPSANNASWKNIYKYARFINSKNLYYLCNT